MESALARLRFAELVRDIAESGRRFVRIQALDDVTLGGLFATNFVVEIDSIM